MLNLVSSPDDDPSAYTRLIEDGLFWVGPGSVDLSGQEGAPTSRQLLYSRFSTETNDDICPEWSRALQFNLRTA